MQKFHILLIVLLFGLTSYGQVCLSDISLEISPTLTEGEYDLEVTTDLGSVDIDPDTFFITIVDEDGTDYGIGITDPESVPFTISGILLPACSDYDITIDFHVQCGPGDISLTGDYSTGGGGGEITSVAGSCGLYTFTSSDGDISASSVWSFGDGEYGTDGPSTSHTYTSNGTYVITVNDPEDPMFCSEYEVITVIGLPESELTASTGCTDDPAGLTAALSASGDPSWTYSWDFGDDSPLGTTQTTSHLYASGGTYVVTCTVTDGGGCSSVQSKTITVGPLELDYTVSNRCLGEIFVPDWVMSGADSYAWSMGDDPETTYDVQYPAHTYTLAPESSSEIFITTLTIEKDGCTAIHSEAVTVSRTPELAITIESVACDPMAYNFTPTASHYTDLSWEIEDIPYPATAEEPMYYLFGTEGLKNIYLRAENGSCEASLFEQITVLEGITAEIEGTLNFCSGSSTSLNAIVSGGGSIEYNWLKDGLSVGTSESLLVSEAGEYVLTVSETGCESFFSVTVEIIELILPTISEITTTPVDCPAASNGTYTLAFDPDPVDGYRIDGGLVLTDPVFMGSGMSEGEHYIVVSHPLDASCNFVEEITIGYDGPVFEIVATPVSCIDGGTFNYVLTGTDATIDSIGWYQTGGDVYMFNGLVYPDVPPGFYYANLYLNDGCMVSSSSIQMTVPVLTATVSDNYVCTDGGTTTVEVDPGAGTFTYLWTGGGGTGSTADLAVGEYEVTITDGDTGCELIKAVGVLESEPLEVSWVTTPIGCAIDGEIGAKGSAEVITEGGSGSYTYTWSPGDYTSPLLTEIETATTYSVTIVDTDYGCDKTVSISVLESPAVSIDLIETADCGVTVTASGGMPPYLFQWVNVETAEMVATSITGSAPILPPDDYTVNVVDSYGCSATGLFTIAESIAAPLALEFEFTFLPAPIEEAPPKTDPNLIEEMQIAADQILNQLADCIEQQTASVKDDFVSTCLNPETFRDQVNLSYAVRQQQYTLYYYDRAGNLTKTVPPEGVAFLTGTQIEDIIEHRAEETTLAADYGYWVPDHRLETTYEYNSLHELISQTTPDGGTANYIYDSNKRLRFSQSARQEAVGKYSYTKYDDLGRPVEAGESSHHLGHLDFENQLEEDNFTAADDASFPTAENQEVMFTIYSTLSSVDYYGQGQTYTQNRVSYVIKDEDGDLATTTDQFKTHYSYDVHGNVNWMVQEDPIIGKNYVAYDYDLISGNVKEVHYNEKRADKFFHRYSYDSDNRLVSAETSRDYVIWDTDAEYDYYAHGPLKRKEIGDDHIQGEDYTYTIQGWLKAINNTDIAADDPGQDGADDSNFLTDVFGMTLGYFRGDFTRGDADGTNIFGGKNIYGSDPSGGDGSGDLYATQDLYNGNISSWGSQTNTGDPAQSKTNISVYQYDNLQRIKSSTYYTDQTAGVGISLDQTHANNYRTSYNYDRNGNIHELKRYGQDGSIMDSLVYTYNKGGGDNDTKQKNQLATVNDLVLTETGTSLVGEHVYTYDASGNLTEDSGVEMLGEPLEEHDVTLDIEWNVAGKVKKITKTVDGPQIDQIEEVIFHYDAMGNRIGKEHTSDVENESDLTDFTRYTLDASGNVMAIYEIDVTKDAEIYTAQLSLIEHPIYGSARIGMNTEPVVLQTWVFTEGMAPDYTYDEDGTHTISELSNWIMAGIKTNSILEGENTTDICHCQIKQTAFDYDADTDTYTYDSDDTPLDQQYYGEINNGLAVGETTAGELDLYAVNINNYLGTTNQCLIFNADNEPIKGTETLNQIETQTKPLLSQVTNNENYYRLFILDENRHPKSYLINTAAQGWGAVDEQKGEVQTAPTSINESFDYGRHMAIIEDHINNRSVVYMTRYVPAETEEDCLGKTQLLAYEYGSDLEADPIETILTQVESKDIYGEGELQLSEDGTHLVYYNRLDNISGFAHKTVQVNVFELSGDKLSVVELETIARTLEADPNQQHYGTYGEASAEFVSGDNLLFSQRGIFEENESDVLLQDGSAKQVYYYNVVEGSVSYSSAEGESQFNEIRRGKNKLHYVANEHETEALHELTTTAELPFPVVALEIFPTDGDDDFILISSLSSQPHKLVGDDELAMFTRLVGAKQYEFNDHLGNVRAVASDRRGFTSITETETDVYEIANHAEIITWTDYFPFGMRQRGENTSEYRYSFQGQEHDDEVKGEGNSINYKYRMHDPRVGRFFAVDPLTDEYPHYTPYSFSGNKVIANVELEGLEEGPSGSNSTNYVELPEESNSSQVYGPQNQSVTSSGSSNGFFMAEMTKRMFGAGGSGYNVNPDTDNRSFWTLTIGNSPFVPFSKSHSEWSKDDNSFEANGNGIVSGRSTGNVVYYMTDVTGIRDMTEGNHDIGLSHTFANGLVLGGLYTKMKIRGFVGGPSGYNLEAPGSVMFYGAYRFGTGSNKASKFSLGITPELGGGITIATLRANSINKENSAGIQMVGWNAGLNLKLDVSVRHFSFYARAHTRLFRINAQTIPVYGEQKGVDYRIEMITVGMTYNVHLRKIKTWKKKN